MTTRDTITENLERLRREFPLQARLASADAATHEAYGAILRTWLGSGAAPERDVIPRSSLEQLAALDAIAISAAGIGCYPFSAADTGIQVEFGAHRVNAMCAVDALAIPYLAHSPATIRARCADCDAPLTVHTDESGKAIESELVDLWVDYRQLAEKHVACSQDLCPGIVFTCGSCTAHGKSGVMTLEEAGAVGREFFRFQREFVRG